MVFLTLTLVLTFTWFMGCGEADIGDTADDMKSSDTDGQPEAESPLGIIRVNIRFDVKPPEVIKVIATVINETTGEEFNVEADRNGRLFIEDLLPGTYSVIVKEDVEDSHFPPIEEKGIEVIANDVAAMDVLFTTWPYFEAEDATEIQAPMLIDDTDAGASRGKYIVGSGGKGWARFDIDIPEDGIYIIWGRTSAEDGSSDSFFVGANVDQATMIWDVPRSAPGVWRWSKMKARNGPNPLTFEFAKGVNEILIWSREGGTKLDQIFLTTDPNASP